VEQRNAAMKSSEENLKRRGRLSDKDYQLISTTIEKNIESYLGSEEAYLRTAAIRYIKLKKDGSFLPKLYEMLKQESILYTKIELCECLAEFGDRVIESLVPLLGKIGDNQHKEMGNYDLEKKSYPLPRDIVARILIRIGPSTFPYLKRVFLEKNTPALSEAIDVIGHVTFNHKDYSMEKLLLDEYANNKDRLIEWKLIRAFQSYCSEPVVQILETAANNKTTDIIIRNEAARSLSRVKERGPK
jgi:hypothetical protein